MAKLNSRQNLIDYCLRRLGHPVIEINVDDQQLEDRVDDALQLFREYAADGSRRVYFPVQITCLLYTSPSPRDRQKSRMPSSA